MLKQWLTDNARVRIISTMPGLLLDGEMLEDWIKYKIRPGERVAVLIYMDDKEAWYFGVMNSEKGIYFPRRHHNLAGLDEITVMDPIVFETAEDEEQFKRRLEQENFMLNEIIAKAESFRRYRE